MALDPHLLDRLASALTTSPDGTSSYGSILLEEESEAASMDLLVQSPESPLPFGLWFGEGLPTSRHDDGFADVASVDELGDGTILARLEQANDDGDEVYELVRILVAFTPGKVVTVNRYADPEVPHDATAWSFDALREIVLDPRWQS